MVTFPTPTPLGVLVCFLVGVWDTVSASAISTARLDVSGDRQMRDLPANIECFSCVAGIVCNLHCTQFDSVLLNDISRNILQARFNDFNQLIRLIRLEIDPRQSYKVNTPSDVARTVPTLD